MSNTKEENKKMMEEVYRKRKVLKDAPISVDQYNDFKAKGFTDAKVMEKVGMNNASFYEWKQAAGLIGKKSDKTADESKAPSPKESEKQIDKEPSSTYEVLEKIVDSDWKKKFEELEKEVERLQKSHHWYKQYKELESELKKKENNTADFITRLNRLQTENSQLLIRLENDVVAKEKKLMK